jgi:hypothetical protein
VIIALQHLSKTFPEKPSAFYKQDDPEFFFSPGFAYIWSPVNNFHNLKNLEA